MGFVRYVDEVLGQCAILRALDKAPRVPIAGAAPVSMFDTTWCSWTTRLGCARWTFFPNTLFLISVRSGNPREVCGKISVRSGSLCAPDLCALRISVARFAASGLPYLAGRSAFRWLRMVHGKMEFGAIFAQSVVLISDFRG